MNHRAPVTRSQAAKNELGRNVVHIGASIAAATIISSTKPQHGLAAVLLATAVAITVELARRTNTTLEDLFERSFSPMLRRREGAGITGATTLAVGFLAATMIAPPELAATAILMAGVGDAAGAIVGKRFGNRRIPGGKSIVGSLACLLVAAPIGILNPGIGAGAAITAALLITLLESISTPIDDNLILAPSAALVLLAFAAF